MPVSLVVKLFAVVGFCVVLQQIPLAVTSAPPSFEIVPPEVAVFNVIADTSVVVSVGTTTWVVAKVYWFP